MDQFLVVVVFGVALAFVLSFLVLVFVTPHTVSDTLTKVTKIEEIAYHLVEQNKQLVEQNKRLAEQNDTLSKRLFSIENTVDAIYNKETV